MRIVGGEFRGRTLTALGSGDAGAHLRPTTDRVRETLFNRLSHGGYRDNLFEGCHVLDLFAGTGALGLEALSRGAAHVTFVDDGLKATGLIKRNVATLDVAARTKLIRRDARKLFANDGQSCDLVFLDPPYGKSMGTPTLEIVRKGGWIAMNALIVWEDNKPQAVPTGFTQLDQRMYGDTSIQILEHA